MANIANMGGICVWHIDLQVSLATFPNIAREQPTQASCMLYKPTQEERGDNLSGQIGNTWCGNPIPHCGPVVVAT